MNLQLKLGVSPRVIATPGELGWRQTLLLVVTSTWYQILPAYSLRLLGIGVSFGCVPPGEPKRL